MPTSPWSKPPGLPHRPLRGASRQACHAGRHAGRATHSQAAQLSQKPSGPQACALHLNPPPPSGASRQACHAGGRAGRATQSRDVRVLDTPSAAKTGAVAPTTARSTSGRRCKVEQAARLAMPAVAPAEQHNPEMYGSSILHPARTTVRSTSGRRRVDAAQRVRPLFSISVFSVVCFSPCPPCPLWFAFSVFSVVCFSCALHVVSDVGQAF